MGKLQQIPMKFRGSLQNMFLNFIEKKLRNLKEIFKFLNTDDLLY